MIAVTCLGNDFEGTYDSLRGYYLNDRQHHKVNTGHWQSLKGTPHAQTRELQNVHLEMPIRPTRGSWASFVRPNLPWADQHFEERVSGEPLNPGEQYKNWPWYRGGVESHKQSSDAGFPSVPAHEWAYLAAFVDGEGCFTCRNDDGRYHLTVTQKDRTVLDELHQRFMVGHVRGQLKGDGNETHRWQVSTRHHLAWLIRGMLPYLRCKVLKAQQVLESLEARLENYQRRAPDVPLPGQLERFSHSYMERVWPRNHQGIRYRYGDLYDLLDLLAREPYTRQAYLPIWFPEDLAATTKQERVPCTLGYHFMLRHDKLHCFYPMRSVDFVRYLRDDLYMAGLLVQWVIAMLAQPTVARQEHREDDWSLWQNVAPGTLSLFASSLHIFEGDVPKLEKEAASV